ncbi:type VII toxin-antitoxin system HepT family RNase toxin [Candidatus Harpocratesius sp.]
MNNKHQRIFIKIAELEENLSLFSKIIPKTEKDYISSKKDQLALERLFQICIEEIIDISAILIKIFKLGVPSNEENIFDLLKGKLDNVEVLKEMKRFRNVIVHKYGKINNHLVFQYANERIKDFYNFITNVKKII